MPISSRTPEGSPNQCPLCASAVCVEPSEPAGDATCPNCGTLLWFLRVRDDVFFATREDMELAEVDRLIDSLGLEKEAVMLISEGLGIAPEQVAAHFKAIGADSLDIAELMMELEEETD